MGSDISAGNIEVVDLRENEKFFHAPVLETRRHGQTGAATGACYSDRDAQARLECEPLPSGRGWRVFPPGEGVADL